MQVICNRAEECPFKCIGHSPHIHSLEGEGHDCPYRGHVCVPVQSDFERGQEGLREIPHIACSWIPQPDIPGLQLNVTPAGGVMCRFDSTSEKMPKGICRNCGHPKYTHYHWDGTYDYCDCKKFLPAEPLAPAEKRKPSAVEETIIYWKESFEAGKADCAKTHESLRNEGKREVVDFVERELGFCELLEAKKEEWGL